MKWIQVRDTSNKRIMINSESIIMVQEDRFDPTRNIQISTGQCMTIIHDIMTSYEDIINQIYKED